MFYNPSVLPYNALDSVQYATRTNLKADEAPATTLPEVRFDEMIIPSKIIIIVDDCNQKLFHFPINQQVSDDMLALIEHLIIAQHSYNPNREEMSKFLEAAPVPITSTDFPGRIFQKYFF